MARIQDEAKFHDKIIAQSGNGRKYQHLIREEHQFLFDKLGDVSNKRILIMGCSTGGVTPLARQGAWAYGIDISQLAIKKLLTSIKDKNLSNNAHIYIMNCEQLGFKRECFDIILFIGVLHHLDIESSMAESYRVLKQDGKIFMSEPLGLHLIVNIYRMLTPHLRTKFEHPLKPVDFRIIKKYFEVDLFEGFCLTSILSLIPLYLFRTDKLYEVTRTFLINVDNILFRMFKFLRYFSWSAVVVLKKRL